MYVSPPRHVDQSSVLGLSTSTYNNATIIFRTHIYELYVMCGSWSQMNGDIVHILCALRANLHTFSLN